MRISILMPTYNGMPYVREAVASVFAQDFEDWELIISDDGSKDDTRDFLSTLKDPRVRVHFQPENLNIFGNLNFLFGQASADMTQILCQDDFFFDSGSLGRLLEQWSKLGPEIAFLRANHLADGNGRLASFEGPYLPPMVRPDQSDLLFFIFGCIPGNLSNVSVRTEVVKEAGWFRTDLPYAGDFEFWSRAGRAHPWAIVDTRVAVIRSHSRQASGYLNQQGELLPQLRVVLNILFRNLRAKGYSVAALRLMATTNYTAQHRERGIRQWLQSRKATYLRVVMREFDSAEFSYGPLLGWMVCFASLGGRVFRKQIAARLLSSKPRL